MYLGEVGNFEFSKYRRKMEGTASEGHAPLDCVILERINLSTKERTVIQAIHKGIEIEMELHQLAHGFWKCDYTLIKSTRNEPKPFITVIKSSPRWILQGNTLCRKLVTK
jgi:hypothetical protein